MSSSQIIEKIIHLRKLANDASNINEAANAMALADKLILKYQIVEEDIVSPETQESIEIDPGSIYETARIIPWKSNLANKLAAHYGCGIFYQTYYGETNSGRGVKRFKLVGRKSDIDLIHYMNEWLSKEIERLTKSNAYGKGHIYAFSYAEGAVNGIISKMKESREIVREEIKAEGHATALVKLDAKLDDSLAFMNKKFNLKTTKQKSKSQYDYDAYHKGVSDGKKIKLQAAITGNSKPILN